MRERGEGRRDTARLHLPHVLPFEVDAAALVGAELRHREPALAPQHAQALAGPSQQHGLPWYVGIHAGRHQTPRATKSTIASIASAPYGAANIARECSLPPYMSRVFGRETR